MSDWNKYKHLDSVTSGPDFERDKGKYGEDPQAELLAEAGLLIDGKPLDLINKAREIVGAHRIYLFTKQPAIEVINIGGVDYNLSDYGLENTFSVNVDILIPWLCIQKKIRRENIVKEMILEDGPQVYG
jgi:hypothetical protein